MDTQHPIGTFLSILPETRTVAPVQDRAGWLRIRHADRTMLLDTDMIAAVDMRTDPFGRHTGTWVLLRDGTTVSCGKVAPDDVLRAMDEADGEGPGALPPPLPHGPDDLLARVVQRRHALARTLTATGTDTSIPPMLGLLRDQALSMAGHVSHPRDWLLLLRDAAFEAAVELVNSDSPLAADRFIALGRQLERDVRTLPAGVPQA